MKKITEKQKQILGLIGRHVKERGFPPTMQELADELGIRSKNAIFKHLAALESKGFIHRHGGGAARGITVLHPMGLPYQAHADNIPVVGRVAAGSPIVAEQNIERYVAVPDYLTSGGGSYFALRVQGDSMIDAGIYEGDLVIVRSTTQAANGDIVVALTGEEATVKRLVASGETMYLKPENPAYSPIPLSQAWSIQGKVVALIRDQVH
ncbi:MAG: transcriptional repressor LexA [candidate division KSB1 bacterium]|nr:transcriptional repressor LexA [candidate division KSB1 bacterium]MDZ7366838.1 transcriptional repressor LexA [candidate division KSB1 bacterium]MDZ7405155.1 transcriptional repressor LexA [candidate division KSB1 bacterium]